MSFYKKGQTLASVFLPPPFFPARRAPQRQNAPLFAGRKRPGSAAEPVLMPPAPPDHGRPGRNGAVDILHHPVYSQQTERFQGTGRRSRRQPRQVRKEATVTVVAGCPVPKRAQSFLRPFVLSGCRAGAPAAEGAGPVGRRGRKALCPGIWAWHDVPGGVSCRFFRGAEAPSAEK